MNVPRAVCDKKSDKKTVVDINRATVEEFTKLHGVGEGLAQRIVADRQKNGPFKMPVKEINYSHYLLPYN